jgi:hypothetical protein
MQSYNPERLRYMPQQAPFDKRLDSPGETYAAHVKDQHAQRQADELLAMRQQAQEAELANAEVSQRQKAIGMQRDERHQNSRDDLYNRQEDRRENSMVLDRQRVEDADTERLLHALYYGNTEQEQKYAAMLLQKKGYMPPEPLHDESMAPVAPGTPQAPPAPPAPKTHVSVGQASSLDKQLDGIDAQYSKGLGVQPGIPRKYIPGQPGLGVAKSNEFLSEGDPLNKL